MRREQKGGGETKRDCIYNTEDLSRAVVSHDISLDIFNPEYVAGFMCCLAKCKKLTR